jgi:ubiquinone/menaquinone biosynthesis C-methylase UbiE
MDKPVHNLHFKFMVLGYMFRDFFSPRKYILNEVGIKPGFHVLDYGCGPGSYIRSLAELVGNPGKIYALDIHPLAIKMVQGIVTKNNLTNVKTVFSDCDTGLPDNSVDVVLLYDVFHNLSEPNEVLQELHRVLKPNGILSFSDHHMKEDDIYTNITETNLFILSRKGEKVYIFSAVKSSPS